MLNLAHLSISWWTSTWTQKSTHQISQVSNIIFVIFLLPTRVTKIVEVGNLKQMKFKKFACLVRIQLKKYLLKEVFHQKSINCEDVRWSRNVEQKLQFAKNKKLFIPRFLQYWQILFEYSWKFSIINSFWKTRFDIDGICIKKFKQFLQ